MAFLETFGFVNYVSMGVWHAAVTKGLNGMRHINPRFTYLLTIIITALFL